MSIFDFFTREAGQERRRALEGLLTQFIPPEMRPQLGLLAEANPVVSMERAGQDAQTLFAPDQSLMDRLAAGGRMASNMAGVVAPAIVAGRVGMPVANAVTETLTGLSMTPQAVALRDFGADEFGGVGISGLPAPRTDAEAMARDILQLRAEGRANEVTNEMMAAADPQYMYFNTPLPMDYESRMARAKAFDADLLHGTAGEDYVAMREGGPSLPVDRAIWASTTADGGPNFIAASRMESAGQDGGRVLPLMARTGNNLTVDAAGRHAVDVRGIRSAADEGYDSVTLPNVREFGSPDLTTSVAIFDPRNIRSRFARFDPEFRHLSNLNAALAAGVPLGLLAMQPEEERY